MIFIACGILLVFTSCASEQKEEKNQTLTAGQVKKKIKKGQTNQVEVTQALGSPNLVSKNSSGDEVWTYSRQTSDSKSGSSFGGFIFFGSNKQQATTSTSTFDLIITFDDKDVVKDYSVVQSQY